MHVAIDSVSSAASEVGFDERLDRAVERGPAWASDAAAPGISRMINAWHDHARHHRCVTRFSFTDNTQAHHTVASDRKRGHSAFVQMRGARWPSQADSRRRVLD